MTAEVHHRSSKSGTNHSKHHTNTKNTRKRIYPHSPQERHSSLTHGRDPMHGFVNLTFVLLVAATFQLVVKNYYQYGFLIDFTFITCVAGDLDGTISLIAGMIIYSLSTLLIIKIQVNKWLSNTQAMIIYTISQLVLYIIPVRIIFVRQIAPLMAGGVAMILVILSLKMHSYFATNTILLKKLQRGRKVDEHFPKNVRFGDYIYFLAAPTLVYETWYPRNESVSYWWALKEALGAIVCLTLVNFCFAQFILPILADIESSKGIFFDIIRLSIPSIIAWLLAFYAFFHCWLNAVAEFLAFADREFYRDWWNANTLDAFWRKWNILVHEWLLRHVYLESVRTAKTSQMTAAFWTFFFSAVYHELIFFIAFRVLRPWFFLAMFAQFPMILISRWMYNTMTGKQKDFWGNINVWLGFFVGQPLIEILYLREWFLVNPSLFCVPKIAVLSWF